MKTIGLIGGMSWESSATYYRLLNQELRERLGGNASARSVLLSVDFAEVVQLQETGDWETLGAMMAACGRHLEAAGVDCVVICANTMHKVAAEVERAVGLPLIHVVDVTAAAVRGAGLRRVGLLGTRYVMEQRFYRERLEAGGVETVVPGEADRAMVHRVIFEELTRGVVLDDSRKALVEVMERMGEQGAEGVVLGCTEFSMLIREGDVGVPVFDTTALHVGAAVEFALG